MASKGAKKGEKRRAGKPNKSTKEIKDILHQEVDFSIVAQKMFELVKGVEIQKTNEKDGSVYYEDKEPNVSAAKLLLEYGFGKPKEQIEVSSPAGKTLKIEYV